MMNYSGLDADSGTFLAEIFFVANLISWAVIRLWVFPTLVIRSSLIDFPDVLPLLHPVVLCRVLLVVLLLMHIWWYYLFLRIAYRMLAGQGTHNAGRQEYEGSSDSETETPSHQA